MKQRIHMNQVDSSPGGGSPPAAPTTSAQPAPQAQGAAPASDVDAIASALLPKLKDSIFAEMRRSGMLGKQPKAQATEGAAPAAPAAPDLAKLRQLDRAIATSGRQLNESAYNRIEKAFAEEAPENASDWLRDYFDGFGGSPAPAAPAGQTTTTATPQGLPSTARGSQPAPVVPLDDKPVLSMNEDERNRYIKAAGVKKYMERLTAEKQRIGRVPLK